METQTDWLRQVIEDVNESDYQREEQIWLARELTIGIVKIIVIAVVSLPFAVLLALACPW